VHLVGYTMEIHNTLNRQTTMHPVGFEPTIPASKRPQTYAIRRRGDRHRLCKYTVFNLKVDR